MANIRAAQKWARASEKRAERNQAVKSSLKAVFRKAASGGADAQSAASAFDKAAGRGIIHKNKANRKKSRLAKALAAKK